MVKTYNKICKSQGIKASNKVDQYAQIFLLKSIKTLCLFHKSLTGKIIDYYKFSHKIYLQIMKFQKTLDHTESVR